MGKQQERRADRTFLDAQIAGENAGLKKGNVLYTNKVLMQQRRCQVRNCMCADKQKGMLLYLNSCRLGTGIRHCVLEVNLLLQIDQTIIFSSFFIFVLLALVTPATPNFPPTT